MADKNMAAFSISCTCVVVQVNSKTSIEFHIQSEHAVCLEAVSNMNRYAILLLLFSLLSKENI